MAVSRRAEAEPPGDWIVPRRDSSGADSTPVPRAARLSARCDGRAPSAQFFEAGSSAAVLNVSRLAEQQSPYVFEGPSFEIWTRIDGTRTEGQIVDELVEAYGAPREQIAHDVHEFLRELLRLGLIVDDEESGGEGEATPHID